MAFNDENLALTVYNSEIPIISAIGHETDTTILDYVSDLRASTPTAAAEKAVPMKIEIEQNIAYFSQRLIYFIENHYQNTDKNLKNLSKFLKAPEFIIQSFKEKLQMITDNLSKELNNLFYQNFNKISNYSQLIRSPHYDLDKKNKDLKNFEKNLNFNIINKKISQQKELNKFSRLLESNSIQVTLKKGYSIVRKSEKIINKTNLLNKDDKINIQFLDKAVDLKIKKI